MDEAKIREALKLFPGSRRAAGGVILEHPDGDFFIRDFGPSDPDLRPEEEMYSEFCTKSEILRLREIRTPQDYLLRLRANAIADSARLVRVMNARREAFTAKGRRWSLTHFYETQNAIPRRYIERLPRKMQRIVRENPYGFAPIREANALCIGSLVGNVVVTSEALRHFFYFTTICFDGPDHGFEIRDCTDAGLIALRIMNGAEAPDFDLDPRERIPAAVRHKINAQVDAMLEFTFGHEFSHLLLGHVSPAQMRVGEQTRTYGPKDEYDADRHAVLALPNADHRRKLAIAGYNVCLALHLLELIGDARPDYPKFSVSDTHPPAIERLRGLAAALPPALRPTWRNVREISDGLERVRDILLARLASSSRDDLLTFYGSIYLLGLGGRSRLDRIDY